VTGRSDAKEPRRSPGRRKREKGKMEKRMMEEGATGCGNVRGAAWK